MSQTSGNDKAPRAASIDAVNTFSSHLYRRIATKDGNLLFSPFSIHSVLTIAWCGAAGRTAQQMAQVLHWSLPSSANARSEDAIHYPKSNGGLSDHLNMTTTLWAQKAQHIKAPFRSRMESALHEIDFAGAHNDARNQINAWVSNATAHKIQEIIPPNGIDPLTRFVLANAIYFKADWREKFDPADTREAPFHLAGGQTIDVPMMRQIGDFRVAQNDHFTVINLLYEGFALSMQVFIPRDTDHLSQLEQTLFQSAPHEWQQEMQWRKVTLSLPRFRFDGTFFLRKVLSDMGMPDAFDPTTANFTDISDDSNFAISDVIHKTYIDVDEEGTEAAGATATILTGGGPGEHEPLTLTIDRPFLFTICAESWFTTDQPILFMGRVMQP